MTDFKLTDEQEAILEKFLEGKNISINAYAGSGKTATLAILAYNVLQSKKGIYCAFNTSMAEEAAAKFTDNVQCMTTHSMAYKKMLMKYPAERLIGNINYSVLNSIFQFNPVTHDSCLLVVEEEAFPITVKSYGNKVAADVTASITKFLQKFDDTVDRTDLNLDGGYAYTSNISLLRELINGTIQFKKFSDRDLIIERYFGSNVLQAIKMLGKAPPAQKLKALINNRVVKRKFIRSGLQINYNPSYEEFVLKCVRDVWKRMNDKDDTIPLTHDGYLKIWARTEPKLVGDFIFVDEAQDSSDVIFNLINNQKHMQCVVVGDRYQQIYEWRGAQNIMDRFPDFEQLKLTKSFRLTPATAALANIILEKHCNDRITGLMTYVGEPETTCYLFNSGDALINKAFELLADGVTDLRILGGVKSICALLFDARSIISGEIVDRVESPLFGFNGWDAVKEHYEDKSGNESKDETNKTAKKLITLIDKYSVESLINLFSKDNPDAKITLSTVHAAKGLEFDKVIFETNKMRYLSSKELAERDRVHYVAMTRSKGYNEGLEYIIDNNNMIKFKAESIANNDSILRKFSFITANSEGYMIHDSESKVESVRTKKKNTWKDE